MSEQPGPTGADLVGDVLPEVTYDERDVDDHQIAEVQDRDSWLRDQVPPHH